LISTPHPWQKPHIFLCCEGRDLGRGGGKLGLIQIGVKEDIYLLDILTYGKNLEAIKSILENPEVDKIMWDGRFASAELFHEHEISIQPVIDVQLVHVYEKTRGRIAARGFISAESMESAFSSLEEKVQESIGMDLKTFNRRVFLFL
jgi:3'-5' exonuclease